MNKINTFEEKLKCLEKLMIENPLSPRVKELTQVLKESCNTLEQERMLDRFLARGISNLQSDVENLHQEVVKLQLGEISEMLNLSFIAKTYFNKSRAWLSQRINGNVVNGKPCSFTERELNIFNEALHDISKRLASVTLKY